MIRLFFYCKKIVLVFNFFFGYYSRSNQKESVGKNLNFRVYILAIAAFVVGTVELIIGGTLDLVANDLGVSISAAGQLITIFSVVFALSGPVLLAVTGKFERKDYTLGHYQFF